MGVPKQVQEMEEAGDKELEAISEKVDEVQPTVAVAEEQKPAEVAEVAETQQTAPSAGVLAEITSSPTDEEARKQAAREASAAGRLKKLQGSLGAQREAYERKVAELEAKVSELTEKNNALEEARKSNNAASNDVGKVVTDEELFNAIRKEYGDDEYSDEDLRRFIEVCSRIGDARIRPYAQRFKELDEEREESARRSAKAATDTFLSRLDADFPGFRDMDANNDPRWLGFLGSSLGGVMEGTSYGDVAKDALASLDYRKFSSVVREFAKQANIVFSPGQKPASGDVMGQLRPSNVGSLDVAHKAHQPHVFSLAEIEAFRRAAFAHRAEERYGMTPDQVADRLRLYEDAEAEGRVK